MRNGMRMLCAGIAVGCIVAAAKAETAPTTRPIESAAVKPFNLSLQPAELESVYAPPSPPRENLGINEGAVHFELGVGYFTDYVYRGIEIFEQPGAEDRPSAQINAKVFWDLGKLPHPFIGVFVNYADADPISTFQEIRPMLGAEWTIRPVILSGGYNAYLYPDRDAAETAEVWGKIEVDDSFFLLREKPLLSPYVYGAYDLDLYNGWYIQAGVSHDVVVEDTGLTLTFEAEVAYVRGFSLFSTVPNQANVNGFQHYQFGMVANYSLNTFLNFPPRYGDWSLQGFVYYTDGIDNDLQSNTQFWGGVGMIVRY